MMAFWWNVRGSCKGIFLGPWLVFLMYRLCVCKILALCFSYCWCWCVVMSLYDQWCTLTPDSPEGTEKMNCGLRAHTSSNNYFSRCKHLAFVYDVRCTSGKYLPYTINWEIFISPTFLISRVPAAGCSQAVGLTPAPVRSSGQRHPASLLPLYLALVVLASRWLRTGSFKVCKEQPCGSAVCRPAFFECGSGFWQNK